MPKMPKNEDPFRPLHFAGCLGLLAVVILFVATGVEALARYVLF